MASDKKTSSSTGAKVKKNENLPPKNTFTIANFVMSCTKKAS